MNTKGEEEYYIHVDGQPVNAFHAKRLTYILIRDANKFIERNKDHLSALTREEKWGQYCHICLKSYHDDGSNEGFRKIFNAHLAGMNFKIAMVRDQHSNQLKVRYILIPIPSKHHIADEEKINFCMFASINSDQLKNLRVCSEESCLKYFLGRPNRKWCSDNCGSKQRNKNKRKRDKKNQYFEINGSN